MMTGLLVAALNLAPTNVEVVIPREARREARVVQYAAEELTNFLSRALGAPVPIRFAMDPAKTAIVLGSNAWSVAAGIDTAKLPRDGFVLRTKGNALYIAGADDDVAPIRRNKGFHFQRATLFGVYEFLERHVGCRFYFPGELGEIVPRVSSVAVPDLDETCAPAWTERSISDDHGSWFDPAADASAEYLKERYRLRMETRQLPCCHGQYKAKIVQRFGKAHPEYFYQNEKGERVIEDNEEKPYSRNAHLCYTSDVWEEIYRDARSYFRGEGPEVRGMIVGKAPNHKPGWGRQASCGLYYDIMPHDGMRKCCCPRCTEVFARAKDPENYANETVWGWTAKIAQRLKDEGLEGSVTQMAYSPYRNVPDIRLPDNVIVTVCNNGGWVRGGRGEADVALVRAWCEKVGKVKLYNNTGKFRSSNTNIPNVPSTTPFAVSAFYNRISPYVRGAYFCGPADRFLYTAMNCYCFSRIAWHGQADIPAIMDEHYRLMYGAAAEPMKAFFDIVERKWMTEIIGNVVETSLGTVHLTPSEFRVWTELYNEKAIAPMAELLDKAAASVPAGSLEARRVALVRREYVEAMLGSARAYVAGLSVADEKARRVAHPPKSVVRDFQPVRITVGKDETDKPFKAVKFAADLRPGKWYRISYFVKGENVRPYARRGGANAVVWQDESADRGKVYPVVGFEGTFDWMHHSAEFRVPKAQPAGCRPEVDLRLIHATGTVRFDGLVVEEISKPTQK